MSKTNVPIAANKLKKIKQLSKKAQASNKVLVKDLLKKLDQLMNRTQQIAYLSAVINISKKEVVLMINALLTMIGSHLKKIGLINLFGLMKIYLIKKSATKAREAVNPFTGELTWF